MQKYKQTTYETCLTCCLLHAAGRINKKLELDCLIHSLKFSKDDFAIGHLDFIAKKFNVNIHRYVDNKLFYNWVKRIKASPKITTEVRKINLNLIDSLLARKPIIQLDAYYLFKVYHYPHWVTILSKDMNGYKIFDSWNGKEKTVVAKTLSKAISSLRNNLRMCPQAVVVKYRS